MSKNSECYLIQGIAIDNSYRHTIYFSSESAQASFFKSKSKSGQHYTNMSYIRIFDGVIRINEQPAEIVNCNYVMFKNTSDKWYYAFIKELNYINEVTTDVVYELDIIQTWFFDWAIQPCYIERQHVTSDAKWEHLCNEPFPLAETTYQTLSDSLTSKSWARYYVIQSRTTTDPPAGGKPVGCSACNGNTYVGYMYLTTSKAKAVTLIENLQKAMDDNVISVQCLPEVLAVLLSTSETAGGKIISNSDYRTKIEGQVDISHNDINGYVPRNNKCYNYPYYCLYVSNQKGVNATYDFAFMSATARTQWGYSLYGDIGVGSPIILSPHSYKGLGKKHDYDLILGTMPQMQFASYYDNAFQQEQMNARVQGTLRTVQSAVAGFAMSGGNPIAGLAGTAMSAFQNSLQLDAIQARQDNTPSNVHNLSGTDSISFNMGSVKPVFAKRVMKKQDIQRLDYFFDVFGYQVNKIGVPNRSKRKQWNYVKTNGCAIKGNVPATIASKICQIHDNGITYWKNGNNVGNYSLDNTL